MTNILGYLIKSNNVNIAKMSRDIDCSRNTIYRAIKGKPCSGEFMLKVATYFNKDVKDIFFTPNVLQIVRNNKTA